MLSKTNRNSETEALALTPIGVLAGPGKTHAHPNEVSKM